MSPGDLPALSVLVPTWNEEANLAECLASCSFADEVVVVDSGSSDGTVEIALAAGARVENRKFDDHARQKNWALERLSHDWALIVDADERVSAGLMREIRTVLQDPGRADGYWIRRRNTFLGREIHRCGWQRDRVLRLFDRRRGRYDERVVHEEVRVNGSTGEMNEYLVHHSCRDLQDWVAKTSRYARLGAEELHRRGRRERFGDLWLRPSARFAKQYLAQGGILEGREGFLLCAISAFGVFLKYSLLRELDR